MAKILKGNLQGVTLSSMCVVYVLNVESSKELWDSLKAKYMADDASSKKFIVSNFTNYKMTNSRPVMEQYNELLGILGRFTQHKMNMDEAILVSCIIDKLPPSWKDFKHILKHNKEELTLVELGTYLHIEESLRVQDSDKPKGNNVVGPLVINMIEHNNSFRYNDNKGKCKHQDTKADPNKKSKVTCTNGSMNGSSNSLKGQNMFHKSFQVYYVTYVSEAYFVQDNDVAWWVDSGETVYVCKDGCWFKTYELLNDGSILLMGNESTALVHRRGCVDLRFSSGKIVSLFNVLHVPNIRKNLVSSSILNNYGYKQVIESNKFVLSKHAFMSTFKVNDSIIWHARLGHVHFKRMQDMSKDGSIPAFNMDTKNDLCDLHVTLSLENKKYFVTFIDDASRFCYVYLLHLKDEALDKFKVFKTEVELQQGFLIKRFRTDRGGEYIDTLYFQSVGIIYETIVPYTLQQNGISKRKIEVPNKKNMIAPCELWNKRKPNVNYLRVWGYSAVVRLPDPKLKTWAEKGIECVFVGYAEHSKAFRFSSVPRPSQRSMINRTEDIGGLVVPKKVIEEVVVQQLEPELKKANGIGLQRTLDLNFNYTLLKEQGMRLQTSWCKWIFKRKLKVNETIEKFKARLVIQGFRQKSRIYYFDTYAQVARISIIRLLIALASIHNMIIHQIDVKTAFLNGEWDEEVYMNQPWGFIMSSNENKVCKLMKSLYRLKQSPKQWHQKFNEVVFSGGYLLNQADKCRSDKGKLSSKFSMKDMGEVDVILVSTPMDTSEKLINNNGQVISQLKYSRGTKYLMKTMDYSLVYTGFPLVLEGYTDASWINNPEDNSSTSVLDGAAGKEAKWLRNLILEIPLWSKPIAHISIRCDSAATLAKAYSQMYNGKSRKLGVRHSMIRKLIMNGVVSIEFVRSQQNLANHLTKELAKDLVIKSAGGMGLKSKLVTEC
ncbi:zinc finger, CCHC-type containing protein [Tanacetum coccineum]